MKISDLIIRLQQVQNNKGDIQVKILEEVNCEFEDPTFNFVDPAVDEFCVENQMFVGQPEFLLIT